MAAKCLHFAPRREGVSGHAPSWIPAFAEKTTRADDPLPLRDAVTGLALSRHMEKRRQGVRSAAAEGSAIPGNPVVATFPAR